MENQTYVGIDCGLDGVLSAVKGNEIIWSKKIPTAKGIRKGRRLDIPATIEIVRKIAELGYTVIIEDPGKHAPSASGLYSMTRAFTMMETLLHVFHIRHHIFLSQAWQSHFWKRPKLPKGQKFDTKAAALEVAQRLWPLQRWTWTDKQIKPDDNLVDATLLAEFGRQKGL